MTYSQAQGRASQKYAKTHYRRIPLDVRVEKFEEIKAAADTVREPVNTFIKKSIDLRLEAIRSNDQEDTAPAEDSDQDDH